MPKSTLILIVLVQITTRPKLDTWEDWIAEILIFLVAVSLGSVARIAFLYKKKRIDSFMEAGLIFLLGLSFGFLANVLIYYYNVQFPRFVAVWVASFMGEILAFWSDKRGFKMLDKGFEKLTGKSLEDGQDNTKEDTDGTP
jgi:CHASE2 domain-containing sensor protein